MPEPPPQRGEVKVRIAYNGLCGTDLHEYYDGPIFVPQQPHPITGRSAPITVGHEAAGTVTELGDGVTSVKVGDRVTIEPLMRHDGSPEIDYNFGLGSSSMARWPTACWLITLWSRSRAFT